MSEIAGVHRRVVYRATFNETDGQTSWSAIFELDGHRYESHGCLRDGRSALPNVAARVHIALQLYIESALAGNYTAASRIESRAANK